MRHGNVHKKFGREAQHRMAMLHNAVLSLIQSERITTTAVVPTMLHRLLQLPDATLAKYDTSSLRGVVCGGAPLSGPLARRFIERFGPVLYNFYGATETGGALYVGSLYRMTPDGTLTTLFSFDFDRSGMGPHGALTLSPSGVADKARQSLCMTPLSTRSASDRPFSKSGRLRRNQ